jgi:transposase-like protein
VRAGPAKFKLKAVKLSQLKGAEVRAVAEALEIHPFMLSRWRKEARDGVLRGRTSMSGPLTAQEREAFGETVNAMSPVYSVTYVPGCSDARQHRYRRPVLPRGYRPSLEP